MRYADETTPNNRKPPTTAIVEGLKVIQLEKMMGGKTNFFESKPL
jgi:hypothetical protein